MYKVVKYFTDLQDSGHAYKVGDIFPRKGAKVSDERIALLSGNKNRQGVPLIKKVEDEGLNPATPAQPEKVEREAPLNNESDASEVKRPRKNRKKDETK